jgi:hypothetical protein
MFESRSCVLLRLFVLAEIVMMSRLMVMMRGGVVVSGRLVVMLTRRMLRCLWHLRSSSLRVNNRKSIGYFPNMTRSPAKSLRSIALSDRKANTRAEMLRRTRLKVFWHIQARYDRVYQHCS